MPAVNIQSAEGEQKAEGDIPPGKLLAWAWCADPSADWSCLPVEITRYPVQPWLDCALELRLRNTGPCSVLFPFLMVTPDFPLRRQGCVCVLLVLSRSPCEAAV